LKSDELDRSSGQYNLTEKPINPGISRNGDLTEKMAHMLEHQGSESVAHGAITLKMQDCD
jgi:hypothetical protein